MVRAADVPGVVRAEELLVRALLTGAAPAAGAMPHTEQKPSSMVPVQPGCVQWFPDTAAAGLGAGAPTAAMAGWAAGAMPQTVQKPSSIVPVQPGRTHAVMASPPSL